MNAPQGSLKIPLKLIEAPNTLELAPAVLYHAVYKISKMTEPHFLTPQESIESPQKQVCGVSFANS